MKFGSGILIFLFIKENSIFGKPDYCSANIHSSVSLQGSVFFHPLRLGLALRDLYGQLDVDNKGDITEP